MIWSDTEIFIIAPCIRKRKEGEDSNCRVLSHAIRVRTEQSNTQSTKTILTFLLQKFFSKSIQIINEYYMFLQVIYFLARKAVTKNQIVFFNTTEKLFRSALGCQFVRNKAAIGIGSKLKSALCWEFQCPYHLIMERPCLSSEFLSAKGREETRGQFSNEKMCIVQ